LLTPRLIEDQGNEEDMATVEHRCIFNTLLSLKLTTKKYTIETYEKSLTLPHFFLIEFKRFIELTKLSRFVSI